MRTMRIRKAATDGQILFYGEQLCGGESLCPATQRSADPPSILEGLADGRRGRQTSVPFGAWSVIPASFLLGRD
jgi:hypothetical protein